MYTGRDWIGLLAAAALLAGCAATGKAKPREGEAAAPVAATRPTGPATPATPIDDRGIALDAADQADVADDDIRKGTGSFISQSAARRNTRVEVAAPGDVVLNFEKTAIGEVVNTILGDMLGLNYVVDPAVTGTVSLAVSKPLQRDDLLPTLETLLRMNGAVLTNRAGVYSVVPAARANAASLVPQAFPSRDKGYQLLVVPLKFISAAEMQSVLQPLLPDSGIVKVDTARNHLVIAGTGAELEQARATVAVFDVDQMQGMSVGLFRLEHADASSVRDELQTIMGADADGPLANMIRFLTISRMNALAVVTTQSQYLDDARTWIERLDRSGDSAGNNMYVYPVQNGRAENLANLLSQLFATRGNGQHAPTAAGSGPLSPSPTVAAGASDAPGPLGDVRIIADTENNALVIMAARADYENIRSAIRRLDVLPLQVLVEATIVEVTLADELSYGLQWFFKNGIGDGKSGVGELFPLAVDPSFSYTVKDNSANVRAVLNLLAADSKLDIISSPSLMVLDNRTATIKVGDQVPVRTSETTSLASSGADPLVTSTIQYRDTGVLLEVTPRVNPGGMVVLEITQDVNDVDQTTTSAIDSPTIVQRRIMTSVAVQSGETVVLGGLIRDNDSTSDAGVPGLKNIPGLGRLFSSKKTTNTRTELLVLITPTAISNLDEARQATDEMKRKLASIDFGDS